MSFVIHQGDALTVLRTLPEASVQCCITSPPYWGLRDYGTGQWEGGEEGCDHTYNHGVQGAGGDRATRTFTAQAVYKDLCKKCGAIRVDQQIGMERTPAEYVDKMVVVFREVRRVLRNDGTLWMNLGDSYANDTKWGGSTGGKHAAALHGDPIGRGRRDTGLKSKDLVGIPWRLALALQADGWYLRSDIIWHKPNPMPESVTDRPTKAHEYIFLLAKQERYYYDAEAIKEPVTGKSHARGSGVNPKAAKWPAGWSAEDGRHDEVGGGRYRPKQNESFSAAVRGLVDERNMRDVWTVPTEPYPEAHFATFPPKLIEPCVIAGCPVGGTILDPFAGSGTTGFVARKHGRNFIGIELNAAYVALIDKRMAQDVLPFHDAPQVNSNIGFSEVPE